MSPLTSPESAYLSTRAWDARKPAGGVQHRHHRPTTARMTRVALDRAHQAIRIERFDVPDDDIVERRGTSRVLEVREIAARDEQHSIAGVGR